MGQRSSISSEELIAQLQGWIDSVEGEHFEFKEAKERFSFDKLAQNCCAMANEGGGKVLLGVTDARPRRIVGTRAYAQFEHTRRALTENIPLRIEVIEIFHPNGRVLVFDVPSHPIGVPIKYGGVYWSRDTDRLVPMDEHRLRLAFARAGHDFSADICPEASLNDLEPQAIDEFRKRWNDKSGRTSLADHSH